MKFDFSENQWNKTDNGYELSIPKEKPYAYYIVQVYGKEGDIYGEVITDIYDYPEIVKLVVNTPFDGYALLMNV
ncbi:hypothetical protein [Chryseobacterium pennipullorum]|uniref:Uncharacterized protein n=1 Tax=Chryseobacterium pennipullorum TaxID=2258963 RepID=A0A3D9B9E8_9FLAO|nr:hypothetical protein [Chryseobacterium pennipullorum]REC50173.1 hypothetical protein DRF67_01160 [Chryseobacterium pennipullorum]